MRREYMRVLVSELDEYEAQGWQPAERDGAIACTAIHGGQVLVALVWRPVEESALLADPDLGEVA